MPEQKNSPRKKQTRTTEQDSLAQLGRLQPQAIDLEKAVLGACIIEQDAFATVSDFLKPHSFYESKHQVIFQAIQSLAAANSPIDVLTVVDQLQKHDDLENAGGPAYIAELSRTMLSAAHLEFHARIVAQKDQPGLTAGHLCSCGGRDHGHSDGNRTVPDELSQRRLHGFRR